MNIRKHIMLPELWPLLGAAIVAGMMSSSYIYRLATKGPEVTWSHHGNPEPWQVIKPQQRIKMMGKDLSEYGRPAPKEAYEAIGQ